MAFDMQQRVFDRRGVYLEAAALRYREELMERFTASPEGQALLSAHGRLGWADTLMDFGIGYLGATPAQLSPEDCQTILFELFPRKVSAPPDCGGEIIGELRAFWTFLEREFHLANASACLALLDAAAARRLEQAMRNTANFGFAKSFLTMGRARGFDLATPEGLQTWTATYNAELGTNATRPPPTGPHAAGTRQTVAQRSTAANRRRTGREQQ